jgi:hypothetical protein
MIGYYKKHVLALSERVHNIRQNTADLDLLIETQLYILKRVLITEERKSQYKSQVSALKGELRGRRLAKKDAALLKSKIGRLGMRVKDCQWLLYIWRCFGDAIAFSYLDKWAIKPFYFESKTTHIKQSAGHMGGKDGLYREFALVLDARKHEVPALLTDLTNTIRHGDVSLLGASDPYVIEVKSSANVNQRVVRQSESIRDIHSYMENDGAENVRGMLV